MNDEYLRDLHSEVRQELVRIDGKVSTLLAIFGVAVSLVTGALLAGDADPTNLTVRWRLAFWLAAGFAGLGIAMLLVALSPITKDRSERTSLGYFGHVAQYDTVDELRRALAETASTPADRRLHQLHTLSRIVRRKYCLMRAGIVSYAAGVLLAIVVAASQ